MSQFFYIHPDNPQTRLINQAVALLREGAVVVYPTDSGYAMGCMLGDKHAMDRIVRIRQLDPEHNFTLVCRDLSEISLYAQVSNSAFRLIKNNTPGAYTFILKATKEVPRRLMTPKRKTIGLRVPDNNIAQALLEALGEPLMSTSLILPGNDFTESDPEEIRDHLEHQVDLIINGGYLGQQPTTVIDLTEDAPVIVREGVADSAPFH
ncbi:MULTISPECIES: L-threonylcarbamoyladenylate synthase [Plesiomonas]|jgi:tRNA threonylcarbamoyl adenosine modification protein (Sua5/YciO/YrdC/YwlC family)|uniref:L-threonylcarbamoyladenylate synthase n=1 Tax=Plesiomonas TaxID=702 RepID=UPI0006461D86|nr:MULTISPECIES: L-threonylcarbamoyladenylate synthase [Plesiomonas]KAB7679536.1 threonylcarbamoyl-AMP synthase [Plesiomonas shigelloides]KAB7693800.1 threonylcarbamoyl-AMP synthase [Plesiomonas shigelloides]MCX2496810.1 L-threonylcarbamoyladenylate synthase [Plesiomonas shigelloides]PVU66301.1 threonylcarbamoyl-AMP synthase [Plesiomonas shigelloides]QWK96158.1 threonylcarbamoyl-AMP synthase [Plesiomonas shigelloides]